MGSSYVASTHRRILGERTQSPSPERHLGRFPIWGVAPDGRTAFFIGVLRHRLWLLRWVKKPLGAVDPPNSPRDGPRGKMQFEPGSRLLPHQSPDKRLIAFL